MVSARTYDIALRPQLRTDGFLRDRRAAAAALIPTRLSTTADGFQSVAANDATYALPRQSLQPEVEPVATSAWGRAWQMMRSWFQPATTAVLLGAGLVPSMIGSTGGAGATPMVPPPAPPEPQAPTASYAPAPALHHNLAPAVTRASSGDREAAVSTALDMLFGPTAANDETYDLASVIGRPRLEPSPGYDLSGATRSASPFGAPRSTLFDRPSSVTPFGPALATYPTYGATREEQPLVASVVTSAATPSLADVMFRPATPWAAELQPRLERGTKGEAVVRLQERLNQLGYDVGSADGSFGRATRAGVLEFQFDHRDTLRVDGRVGQATWRALALGQDVRAAEPTHTPGGLRIQTQYRPFAQDTIRLFEEAATKAGLPRSWASSPGLHNLLRRESHGEVGKLNYTYGSRSEREVHAELRAGIISARSSATGLGQLLLSNVDAYYPSGRAGIGDPLEEAVGMLRYIDARYGSPAQAWASYGRFHEGY